MGGLVWIGFAWQVTYIEVAGQPPGTAGVLQHSILAPTANTACPGVGTHWFGTGVVVGRGSVQPTEKVKNIHM